jgi:acetyl-CoA acetyltransferase family protein
MTDALIVDGVRTPIGRAHRGSLVDVDAFALAEIVVLESLSRAQVTVADIDDIVLGESLQGGGVIARNVAVRLGLHHVPGLADNRHCAAGLSAVQIAAAGICSGMDRVIIAGGTESLSSMPKTLKSVPASAHDYQDWMSPSHPEMPNAPVWDMPVTVGENTARLAGVSRAASDEWAYHSHRRAVEAISKGYFESEIVPVSVGDSALFAIDEHPRADTTIEKLASLPVLHPELEGATVTAGNSAGLNDGAAAVVVVAGDYATANGLRPLARIRSWASVGVEPARTGLAPTLAIPKALERARLVVGDVDLFEINEAFCAMAVATAQILGLDHAIVNVNGSGCSLGHPIAATGARMVVTMVNELRRRDATLGCVAMCAGGGMGSALVLERV